jgi:hypothetical protein
MTISNEIINMLQNQDEIDGLYEQIREKYNDTTADWADSKHMLIDETCTDMDLDDIKKIVNEYGILEIMDLIRDNYGDEFISGIMEKTMDMRYRSLFYNILDEYIDYLRDIQINAWDSDNDDEDEDEEDQVDSDTASDADTDEEN